MKVLAFAASSSKNSINHKLVTYAVSLLKNADVEMLDINDYEMPLFSEDKEKELGQPEAAKQFYQKIGDADALIIAYAEHNLAYTVAFKNLFDWTSRINMKVYQDKPIVMLSTSPGPGGGINVLALAKKSAPYFGGNVAQDLSIPSFYDNFDLENGCISNPEMLTKLEDAVETLLTT